MIRQIDQVNLLVTGGAGFMGSHFIKHMLSLEDFQAAVVNIDALTYCGREKNLQEIAHDKRYHFIQGDILDRSLIDQILYDFQIGIIVHFAAESHVDRSIASAEEFFMTNTLGTVRLLEAVKKRPYIHFHHISTDEVYGATTPDHLFTEQSPYRPNSPYAASKAASDHAVRSYCQTYRLSCCLSHSVNNYGPSQFPEKFIPLVITSLLEKKNIPIYGKGDQVRDWLYVQDHSCAVEKALRYGENGGVYNFSAGVRKKNIDLVKEIIQLFCSLTKEDDKKFMNLITHVKDRAAHDFCYAVDPTLSQRKLFWKPQTSFEEGLRNTVCWYLEHARVSIKNV